jgi:hypothetical protein
MGSDASGWAFLVVSINGAAYTLNAYRPTRNNRLLFGWSFFASWITVELAPFHLVWQVVATALFARKGALRTTPGPGPAPGRPRSRRPPGRR